MRRFDMAVRIDESWDEVASACIELLLRLTLPSEACYQAILYPDIGAEGLPAAYIDDLGVADDQVAWRPAHRGIDKFGNGLLIHSEPPEPV